MAKKKYTLHDKRTCALCLESMPAGMTAYYDEENGWYTHYGQCKGVQRRKDAMNVVGLDKETVGSIRNLADYLYRDELKDFESREEGEHKQGHIFLDVERVKKFLDGLP